MKRFIAILLVFSIVVSLSGCHVNTDGIKDAASEAADELVDDAVDYVEEEIDNAITDFKTDLINKFNNEVNALKEKINQTKNNIMKTYTIHYIATDATNIPAVQYISRIDLFSKISKQIPVKEGYRFLGWGTSANSAEVVYSPGQKWNAEKSEVLYAIWEECSSHSFSCDKVIEDNIFTTEKEETYVIQCKHCLMPYPLDDLNFSVFLQYYYPTQKNIESISENKKTRALDPYIKAKTLMTVNALELPSNQQRNTDELGPFEFYAMVVSKTGKIQENIPILNSEAFFLFQNYLPAAFSDAGIESPLLDSIDDTKTILSFVELCGAIDTTTKAEETYRTEKEKGIANIYNSRNAYIDYALSNANTLAAFANYLSEQYDFSVGVPSADIDAILEMVEELAVKRDLQDYYRHLVAEESIINRKPETVNDILSQINIPIFATVDNNEYDSEDKIYAAMKKGPTAKEIAEAIPFVLQKAEKNSNSTAFYEKSTSQKIAESLWYYYGWRLEYEYSIFIEWIYNDEPCDFQSYLKNPDLVE